MPSVVVGSLSGGVPLAPTPYFGGNSGNPLGLGAVWPWAGVNIAVAPEVSGVVYVALPPPMSGSASLGTVNSGVVQSGGFLDGVPVVNGGSYYVSKSRLVSGIETPRLFTVTANSGLRVYWECDTQHGR
jgi:hypothetical protein